MGLLGQIIIWSFVGSVASLIGGVLLALRKQKFTHHQTLLLTSFAAGVILATAFFDLLPEAIDAIGQIGQIGQIWPWVVGGVAWLFGLEKFVIWYHHHHEEHEAHGRAVPWMLTVGDTIHNFIDGVVMAGTFLVAPSLGIVTALAVAAHEIPHEMADFGVLLSHGWSAKKTILVNIASAAVALVGALLVWGAKDFIEPRLPMLLAFSAGSFVYLACSDLIPELHHDHRHDRMSLVTQVAVFGVGIILVWGLIKILSHTVGIQ